MSEKKVVNSEEQAEEALSIYQEKAIELAKKYDCQEVFVYQTTDEKGEPVVGYMKSPSYLMKLAALGKAMQGDMMIVGEELRQNLTIQEESDPRTYSPLAANDKYRLGMATLAMTTIEIAANEFKKK